MRATASSSSRPRRRSPIAARAGRCAGPPSGGSLQQQGGDRGRTQHQSHGQRRRLRGGVEEMAGDRQVGGDDQALPRPVLEDPVAEHRRLPPWAMTTSSGSVSE